MANNKRIEISIPSKTDTKGNPFKRIRMPKKRDQDGHRMDQRYAGYVDIGGKVYAVSVYPVEPIISKRDGEIIDAIGVEFKQVGIAVKPGSMKNSGGSF